jgi:hypothetical protein
MDYSHSISNNDMVALIRQVILNSRHFACLRIVSSSTLLWRWLTHIYPDNDAKQSRVDACNSSGETLFACRPVPCNWLSAMMSAQAEGMVVSLVV